MLLREWRVLHLVPLLCAILGISSIGLARGGGGEELASSQSASEAAVRPNRVRLGHHHSKSLKHSSTSARGQDEAEAANVIPRVWRPHHRTQPASFVEAGAQQKQQQHRQQHKQKQQQKRSSAGGRGDHGSASVFLEELRDLALKSGSDGLPPAQQAHVYDILTAVRSDILPAVMAAYNNSQEEVNSLFQQILECEVETSTKIDDIRERFEVVKTARYNTTICLSTESTVYEDKVEACKQMRLWKQNYMPSQFTNKPGVNSPEQDMLDYFKLMDQRFCGSTEEWQEVSKKCRNLEKNYTEVVKMCKPFQSAFETNVCSWQIGKQKTCSSYSTCRADAVGLYQTRLPQIKAMVEKEVVELRAVDKVECLWEAWNISAGSPCTIPPEAVERCLQSEHSAAEFTVIYPEIPDEQECPPKLGDHSISGDLPCTENFVDHYYRSLDLEPEVLERVSGHCRSCVITDVETGITIPDDEDLTTTKKTTTKRTLTATAATTKSATPTTLSSTTTKATTTTPTTTSTTAKPESTTTTTATTTTTVSTTLDPCLSSCTAPSCIAGDVELGGRFLEDGTCTAFCSEPNEDGIRSCGMGSDFERGDSVSCAKCGKPEEQCVLWGDPHIVPFDREVRNRKGRGSNVNMYEYGDYWVVKNPKVSIQGRYWSTRKDGNSATRAIAIGGEFLNDNVLLVEPLDGVVKWNKEEILTEYPSTFLEPELCYINFHNKAEVVRTGGINTDIHGLDIMLPLGVRLVVNRHSSHLDVLISMHQLPGGIDGHCGSFDGDASDDTTKKISERMGEPVDQDVNLFEVKDYSFVGCFKEVKSNRDLKKKGGTDMGPDGCAVVCADFDFFGIEANGACYCGNKYGSHGKATDCDCEGDGPTDAGKQCVYSYFDSVQPPEHSLEDCKPAKLAEAEQLCTAAMAAEEVQNQEVIDLCKMDVCFGGAEFAEEDAFAGSALLSRCASTADVQRACGKELGMCSAGGDEEIPANCDMSSCVAYKKLGWWDEQIRLLADGQARGGAPTPLALLSQGEHQPGGYGWTLTNIAELDPRAGICISDAGTLEECTAGQCTRRGGLLAQFFYFDKPLARVPDFSKLPRPASTRIDHVVNYQHETKADHWDLTQNEYFAARWLGFIRITTEGDYSFKIGSDDGSRLLVDGYHVVENNDLQRMTDEMGSLTMTSGLHTIELQYFQNKWGAGMVFSYSGPDTNGAMQVVPQSVLFASESAAYVHTVSTLWRPMNFYSKDGCRKDFATVDTDVLVYSFTVKPTTLKDWRVVRNDDKWISGGVHVQFRNNKFEFSLKHAQPTDTWFNYKFEDNKQYDMKVVYSKAAKNVKLYLDGTLTETKTYRNAITAKVRSGYIGCWRNNNGAFKRRYEGEIIDFKMETELPSE